MSQSAPGPLHQLAVAVLAGSVLAFEIVLLRIFEFSHWHHFAGLTIALALLGFGAAGTLLSLLGSYAARLADRWFSLSMLITSAGLVGLLMLHSRVALRPVFAMTDPAEMARLLAVDFAAFIPFFGAGLALGQVFARWPRHVGRLYALNLLGSGLGTLAAIGLLAWLMPERALALIAAVLLAFAALFAIARSQRLIGTGAVLLLVVAGGLTLAPPEANVSDFKALARVTDLPDAVVMSSEPGLHGRFSLVRSASLRFAPGLSLNWTGEIPVSDAAVIGSDRIVPVQRDYREPPAHGAASLVGLPLSLRPEGTVLAVGSGTWATPAHAVGRDLTWVVSDLRAPALAIERGLRVETIRDVPERFLARSQRHYDIISLDRVFDGRDASGEDYLMTIDGLALALSRLGPNGLLAIPLDIEYPPRHGPRLFKTVNMALRKVGVERPAEHVIVLRGLRAMLLLMSPSAVEDDDIATVKQFSDRWSFDRVWYRGLAEDAVNRHHVLDEPAFFMAARAVFEDQPLPAVANWFETAAATNEQPYFWRAMRWSRLPTLFEQLGPRVASYLDWTLIMSAVALLATSLAAALMIVAPLGRMPRASSSFRRRDVIGYFSLLGIGFMLVELTFLQRIIAYVDVPVLASALVFAVFMIGAGMGSASMGRNPALRAPSAIFGVLAAGAVIALAAIWWPGRPLLLLSEPLRICALVAAMAPLAWAMGRPFPWGLASVADSTSWLPWSWAINGFASVAAASMATLLSVHFGQPFTLIAGLACYAGAWFIATHVTRSPVRQ